MLFRYFFIKKKEKLHRFHLIFIDFYLITVNERYNSNIIYAFPYLSYLQKGNFNLFEVNFNVILLTVNEFNSINVTRLYLSVHELYTSYIYIYIHRNTFIDSLVLLNPRQSATYNDNVSNAFTTRWANHVYGIVAVTGHRCSLPGEMSAVARRL